MGNELAEIQRLLHDQSISSSFLPLIVVTTIIFGGSLIFLYKLFYLFRVPKIKLPTVTPEQKTPRGFQLRQLVRYIHVPIPSRAPTDNSGEIDKLRDLVKKLEQANALERKQHASDLARITALQSEVKTLTEKREEDRRLLDLERARNLKSDEKIQSLETKLQDAIRETERIFEQNAKVAMSSSASAASEPLSPAAAILKDFPPEPSGDKD